MIGHSRATHPALARLQCLYFDLTMTVGLGVVPDRWLASASVRGLLLSSGNFEPLEPPRGIPKSSGVGSGRNGLAGLLTRVLRFELR